MAQGSTAQANGAPHKGTPADRPLSPHLQVWKWHVTMATSICHRMSGMANAFGLIFLAWWLVALAMGPAAYAQFSAVAASPAGLIVLLGFTASVSYHLLNGIRHLIWDAGLGFSLGASRASGILVFVGALALTAAIWGIAVVMKGGLA